MIRSVVDKNLWNTVSKGRINSNSYDTALGFNMIRIKPNMAKWSWKKSPLDMENINRLVTGVMINDFSYSLASEWETMQTPFDSGAGVILGGIGTASGGGEMGSVFRSKKYWKKSGYLEISPQIRIFDIDGDGLPLRVAGILVKWATAADGESISEGLGGTIRTTVTDALTKVASNLPTPPLDTNLPASPLLGVGAGSIVGEGLETGARALENTLEEVEDLFSLRQSPPPLIVEVGKIFKHDDMVLTNVEFSFSREVTKNGPMYIDATLTLSTRKIVKNNGDIGLKDRAIGGLEVNVLAGESVIASSV